MREQSKPSPKSNLAYILSRKADMTSTIFGIWGEIKN
jgi:hypothetical protein